jgi:hypothetical protein
MNQKTFVLLSAAALIAAGTVHAQQAPVAPHVDDLVVSADALTEDKPVGDYGQPEWVKHRRFSTTRIPGRLPGNLPWLLSTRNLRKS